MIRISILLIKKMSKRKEKIFEGDNLIFIVGAPRSGTTWLQSMLASSSKVSTGAETEFFTYYIKKLYESWRKQKDLDSLRARGITGLPFYFSEEEFDEYVREFVSSVMKKLKGKHEIFVEKTPSHALVVDTIHKSLPEAKFINIVRDGRDVVASIIAAGRGWGYDWAPSNLKDASKMWIHHVESAREGLKVVPKKLWMEVKYEDLLDDTTSMLQKVGKFVGVNFTENESKKIANNFKFSKMYNSRYRVFDKTKEPRKFFRKGKVGTWRQDFNVIERLILQMQLRPYLKKLGYI